MYKALLGLLCSLLLALPASESYSPPELTLSTLSLAATVQKDRPANGGEIKLRAGSFDPIQKTPAPLAGFPIANTNSTQPFLAIIQFSGPILKSWQAEVSQTGVKIYQYLPDYAYLARLNTTQAAQIAALKYVRWVGPFQPSYKVDPALLNKNGRAQLSALVLADEPTIGLTAAITAAGGKTTSSLNSLGPTASKAGRFIGLRSVRLEADLSGLARLAALDAVVWLEPYSVVKPSNDTAAWITQSKQTGLYPIWGMGLTGAGPSPATGATPGTEQIVALADSGVYMQHVDFEGPLYPNPVILGLTNWGAAYGSPDPDGGDSIKHGTHVAGTIAGRGHGNSLYKGMAYGARLYVQQLGPNLEFLNDPAVAHPVLQLMTEARQKGARLQNNSWNNASFGGYDSLAQDADQFMWDNPDFLGIWSAGNYGSLTGSIASPATAKNVLAVGSSPNTSNYDGLSYFSGRGPTQDGRIKPDLVAPGECLNSPYAGSTSSYICKSGTSMAAPVTSGSAALVRDWYIHQLNYATPQAALIKATLINSADYEISVGGNLPEKGQGWGRILLQSVMQPPTGGRLVYADNLQGLNTGESSDYTYEVTSSSQPLKISLAWTDPAGYPGAARQLVNDLDLYLIAPDGTQYLGNNFNGQFSVSGGSWDSLNNVEGVTIQNPAIGTWKVRVKGFNVAHGPQPFALAVRAALDCSLSVNFVTDTTDNTATNCNVNLRKALSEVTTGYVYLTKLPLNSTLYPLSPLPPVNSGVGVLAFCLMSSSGTPSVRLEGSYLAAGYPDAAGLQFGGTNRVKGLAIGNFPGSGLEISGSNHRLECSWFGTLDGTTPASNRYGLKLMGGAADITIGNPDDATLGNLISGNRQGGIWTVGPNPNIRLSYNLIGYKSDGISLLKNSGPGLKIAPGAALTLLAGNRVSNR